MSPGRNHNENRKCFELSVSENTVFKWQMMLKTSYRGKFRALNERRKTENQMIQVSRSQRENRRTNLKEAD